MSALKTGITRRQCLITTSATAFITGVSFFKTAPASYWKIKERRIQLHNLWTDQYLDLCYWKDGVYLKDSMSSFNYLLRDWRTGEIGDIFRGVFDQLFWLNKALNNTYPFEVVSGFRSISTNKVLQTINEGVAKNSLHTYGMAIDIRIKTFTVEQIWEVATSMGIGGAGLYNSSQFVHLDVGPARSWSA